MPGHSHRPTLKKSHKSFKSKHATKSAIKAQNKGKVEKSDSSGPRAKIQTKADRRNTKNQVRLNKNFEVLKDQKFFDGRKGVAKIVAVIPISSKASPTQILNALNKSGDVEIPSNKEPVTRPYVERFKQNLHYITPSDMTNLFSVLDVARIADVVVFGMSAVESVSEFGDLCIRCIESQGVSSVVAVCSDFDEISSLKAQNAARSELTSVFSRYFPSTEKLYDINNFSESLNALRTICQKYPTGISWRDSRPYLLADDVAYENGQLIISGTVRGHAGLSPDRLVHIPGYDDYQVAKIELLEDNTYRPENQESLDELQPEQDIDMEGESEEDNSVGVRLDGHHYLVDEEDMSVTKEPKKIPKGMSDYQAHWIVDSVDYDLSESEIEDEAEDLNEFDLREGGDFDDDMMSDDHFGEGGEDDGGSHKVRFADDAEYEEADDYMELTPEEESRQLTEYRKKAKEDLEFPDEIEIPPDVPARERLSRYRGVKNLSTCTWHVDEPQDKRAPESWTRLLRIANYRATRNRILKETMQNAVVPPGSNVKMYIDAPRTIFENFKKDAEILAVYGLHEHEHKQAVVNASVTPEPSYEEPVRSKEELIVCCGPRRLRVQPMYSAAGSHSSNNVYKYERFLHKGRSSTATFIGPVMFGKNIPIVMLKQNGNSLSLVATGNYQDINHRRILVKRAIITGHPLKIHKKLVTVRYMFFTPEDVMWYKAVPLFTKHGRTGYIKESLGTHGYFKCTFDGKLDSQDTIGMALFKREWPRLSQPFYF